MEAIVRRIKSDNSIPRKKTKRRDYVIVRTQSAGVFAGYVKSRKGNEVVMVEARRIWFWAGAASLSTLAEKGTSKPNECKFPVEVSEVLLIGVIEILKTTAQAEQSIREVPIWTK